MNDLDVLDDPALAGLFEELRALGAGTPPPIGDELAALFSGVTPLARRRHPAVVIAFLSAAVLGGTVGSAAANALPDPAQRFVAGVIGTFTPFDLPIPADEAGLEPAPPAPVLPTPPAHEPEQGHSTAPSDRQEADEEQAEGEQADEVQNSEEQSSDERTGEDGSDARPDDSGSGNEHEPDEVRPAPVEIEDSPAPSAPASDEPSAEESSSDGSGNLTELDRTDSDSSDGTE